LKNKPMNLFGKSLSAESGSFAVASGHGIIHWSYVSPVGVNPGAAGILSALEELQNKQEAK